MILYVLYISKNLAIDNFQWAIIHKGIMEMIDNNLLKSDMVKPWAFKTVVQLSKTI